VQEEDVQESQCGCKRFASIALPPTASNDDPDYDGIIGRNIMEYYVMYFDYEGHAVYLKPNV